MPEQNDPSTNNNTSTGGTTTPPVTPPAGGDSSSGNNTSTAGNTTPPATGGDSSAGNTPTPDPSAGNNSSTAGDTSAGNSSTGNASTGNSSSGDSSTGNISSGDTSGGNPASGMDTSTPEGPTVEFEEKTNLQKTFTNEFGLEINCSGSFSEDEQKQYDDYKKQLEAATAAGDEEAIAELQKKIAEMEEAAAKNADYINSQEIIDGDTAAQTDLAAWDPRLGRTDAFYMASADMKPVIVPFSSRTAASSFYDLVFKLPRFAAEEYTKQGGKGTPATPNAQQAAGEQKSADAAASGETSATDPATANKQPTSTKTGRDATQVPFDVEQYQNESTFYGVSSLMNPYSITKLVGSLNINDSAAANNYLYDVRDQRRFYGISSQETNDVLSVSDPTVSNIIRWSNADPWGRTPYTYQDFVYCKWFGIIPNNRLLTLRRYHAPVYDNLNFEGMILDGEEERIKAFAPRCTVVTYMGENTGNMLSDILKFSTGINWGEAKADIWDVTGNDAEDPSATIDRMFDGSGGFSGAENQFFGGLVSKANTLTGKILSFGKFALGLKSNSFGISQGAFDKLSSCNNDPYTDGTY